MNEKAYLRIVQCLGKYRGQYAAFVGGSFVAADEDREKLRERVLGIYKKMPYIRKIE